MELLDQDGFFSTLFKTLENFFGSLKEIINVLSDSLDLPLRLSGYLPAILGAAVSIVLFTMVVKFIIGR